MATHVQTGVVLADLVDLHITSVLDREHGFAVSLVAVPPRDAPGAPPVTVEDLARLLDMTIVETLPTPAASFLPHAISAVVLEPEDAPACVHRLNTFLGRSPADGLDIDPALLEFALRCAYTPTVLLEQSPVDKIVLASIAVSAPVAIAVAGSGVAVIGVAAGTIVVLATTAVFTRHVLGRVDRWLRRREA